MSFYNTSYYEWAGKGPRENMVRPMRSSVRWWLRLRLRLRWWLKIQKKIFRFNVKFPALGGSLKLEVDVLWSGEVKINQIVA